MKKQELSKEIDKLKKALKYALDRHNHYTIMIEQCVDNPGKALGFSAARANTVTELKVQDILEGSDDEA